MVYGVFAASLAWESLMSSRQQGVTQATKPASIINTHTWTPCCLYGKVSPDTSVSPVSAVTWSSGRFSSSWCRSPKLSPDTCTIYSTGQLLHCGKNQQRKLIHWGRMQ